MSAVDLELGPDEVHVADYAFSGGGELGRRAVLTNKRLVVLAGTKRETHPLGRIRAVRIETGRNWFAFAALALCAGVGFAVPFMVGYIRMVLSQAGASMAGMNEGYVMSGVGIVVGLLCLWAATMAYRGYIRMAVELESETKSYAVQRQDPKLLAFVTKVEHSL